MFTEPLPKDKKQLDPKQNEEQPNIQVPTLKYTPPSWSGLPKADFFFEVLKNGVIIDTISLPRDKEFSISRYHAVIQFKSDGQIYIYDLNSAHGTYLNRRKIPGGQYAPFGVGQQLRIGESTRSLIFQGEIDQAELELLEEQQRTRIQARKASKVESTGVTWGFVEDAVEDDVHEPDAITSKLDENAFYRKDPKKALRSYLESENYDLNFEFEEDGPGHARTYTARIRLPIEDLSGPVYALGCSTKKKDAERAAAMNACEILDSRGMFFKDARKTKPATVEEYDDDSGDDSFFDRTELSKKAMKKVEQKAETFETLMAKKEDLMIQINNLKTKIQNHNTNFISGTKLDENDDLDAYMLEVYKKSDESSRASLEKELHMKVTEYNKLDAIIEIAKPSTEFGAHAENTFKISDPTPEKLYSKPEFSPLPSIINTSLEQPISSSEHSNDFQSRLSTETGPKRFISATVDTNPTKRRRGNMIPMTKEQFEKQEQYNMNLSIEDNVDEWAPPQGQSGDGKTHLNERFGY